LWGSANHERILPPHLSDYWKKDAHERMLGQADHG
jgi:hypothetical protein